MKRILILPVLALALIAGAGCGGEAEGKGNTVVRFHFSRFVPGVVVGYAGVPLTLTLQNDDPIAHEWIAGSEETHERHRTGTEPYHDQVPTEVTVPALTSKMTTVVFDQPGDYPFICHLPGHEAYGMRGTLRILAQ
jgi:uncharacterized cupredoxin-like copper-binding protein